MYYIQQFLAHYLLQYSQQQYYHCLHILACINSRFFIRDSIYITIQARLYHHHTISCLGVGHSCQCYILNIKIIQFQLLVVEPLRIFYFPTWLQIFLFIPAIHPIYSSLSFQREPHNYLVSLINKEYDLYTSICKIFPNPLFYLF